MSNYLDTNIYIYIYIYIKKGILAQDFCNDSTSNSTQSTSTILSFQFQTQISLYLKLQTKHHIFENLDSWFQVMFNNYQEVSHSWTLHVIPHTWKTIK